MWAHLRNGRSFFFRDAVKVEPVDGELHVYAKRKRWIASLLAAEVAAYWFDDVDVTTYSPSDELLRPE